MITEAGKQTTLEINTNRNVYQAFVHQGLLRLALLFFSALDAAGFPLRLQIKGSTDSNLTKNTPPPIERARAAADLQMQARKPWSKQRRAFML